MIRCQYKLQVSIKTIITCIVFLPSFRGISGSAITTTLPRGDGREGALRSREGQSQTRGRRADVVS
jgi:hypothetical protein